MVLSKLRSVRKTKEISSFLGTILFALFTFSILIWMTIYVFQNGITLLSWDFITGDYSAHSYTIRTADDINVETTSHFENKGNYQFFSSRWGVALKDDKNGEDDVVYIVDISENSPFTSLVDSRGNEVNVNKDYYISSLALLDDTGNLDVVSSKDGAAKMAEELEKASQIFDGTLTSKGQGIRGSLLTTLCLIGFALLFSLPLGIGGAIYLSVYAKDTPVTRMIRTLIDVTSGIPSIIFGLAGAIIFIPFLNTLTNTTGGSIFSGSLTLAIMLLPTIIKTVEESINNVPASLPNASLALGASKNQTIFKIILPNALPGILTATLLSIGRIIGESAALVFSMGAIIGDNVNLLDGQASLAVHIWTCLQGETPQYGNACAISIIILLVTLFLSISIKLISYIYTKKRGAI